MFPQVTSSPQMMVIGSTFREQTAINWGSKEYDEDNCGRLKDTQTDCLSN